MRQTTLPDMLGRYRSVTVEGMPSPVDKLLTSRDNSLNAVRLCLAAAVILAHSWPLGGYGANAMERLGAVGVDGFFALSGFLIAGSRVRNDFRTYITRRARRIFPGFWGCLLVTGFVFAPLGGIIGGHGWNPAHSLSYVLDNATLWMTNPAIGGTLAGAPNPGMWNGSLWTLMYEFAAYLLCGAALGIVWVRRNLVTSAAIATVALPVLSWWVGDLPGTGHMLTSALRLFSFFAVGVLAYALRDRLHTTTPLTIAAVACVTVLGITDESALNLLSPIPLTYALLHIGNTWKTSIAAKEDHSYGLYVYGWSVQQVLGMLGLGALVPVPVFAAVSFACTLPLALASWRLVERPAMRATLPSLPARPTGDLHPADLPVHLPEHIHQRATFAAHR